MYGSNSQKKRQKKRQKTKKAPEKAPKNQTTASGNRTHALLNISVGAYH